jgi:N-acetylglucosamine transport system substrate-binding protein
MGRHWLSLGLLGTAMVMVGCSGGSTAEKPAGEAPKGGGTAAAVKLSGEVEVQAFKGGYGIDFYEAAAKEFTSKHPGLNIKVEGTPRVWETLRPRLLGGTPPDLMFPGWGMDHFALADEGQLMPLDDALGTPGADGTIWRDTFIPAMLDLGKHNGKQYVLPYYYAAMGWWYNPKVFKANGWEVPKTYEELLALGEKIKAKGIAPITFQGKYPDYMTRGMLIPWAIRSGGKEAMNAADNLEPGAWKSAAFLEAATKIDELNKRGFFQKGAVSLSHTESQMEFLQGRAAMIPCGTWLKSEMQKSMTPEMEVMFFQTPMAAEGKGDASAIMFKIEPWMVPAKAKNPQAAIELFKFMTSLENAKKFVTEKGTFMAIKGSEAAITSPELKAAAEAMNASKLPYAPLYIEKYPALHEEIGNALTSMLTGKLTPTQFCDRVEAKAQQIKAEL